MTMVHFGYKNDWLLNQATSSKIKFLVDASEPYECQPFCHKQATFGQGLGETKQMPKAILSNMHRKAVKIAYTKTHHQIASRTCIYNLDFERALNYIPEPGLQILCTYQIASTLILDT